jgi:NADPH:quinone reductase-like Zn-dependent oxidoreductase
MRALAHRTLAGPFSEIELPVPTPGPRDLVVEVRAVSVNPVDTKVHAGSDPQGEPTVLGYDAAGVVTAVGDEVTLFSVGDEVFHAGSIARQGTNAQFHAVDERIAGPKPRTLSFAEAAALPLTTITAWGVAVRPVPDPPGGRRHAAGHGRGRRRRVDDHPARAGPHRPHRHRHRVP